MDRGLYVCRTGGDETGVGDVAGVYMHPGNLLLRVGHWIWQPWIAMGAATPGVAPIGLYSTNPGG